MICCKYKWLGALLCIGALTAGCGFSEGGKSGGEAPEIRKERAEEAGGIKGTAGPRTEFDYQMPQSLPGILVNQSGYLPGEEKTAVFTGERLPDRFSVIDKETEEEVFEGTVERKGGFGYGSFDTLTAEGTYYIKAPILGYSYSFRISQDIYSNIFQKTFRNLYKNRGGTGSGEAEGFTLALLLLSYELYPEVCSDDMGIPESGNAIPDLLDEAKYEADRLLRLQSEKTGSVPEQDPGGVENQKAAAVFAASMAKFSYMYRDYDAEYASVCLKAAEQAWNSLEKDETWQEESRVPAAGFFAAAELYRASGRSAYRKAAERYMEEKTRKDWADRYIFGGCLAYISTEYTVDMELCGEIMDWLTADAEEIAYQAGGTEYLIAGTGKPEEHGALLWKMVRLTVADHVITNHEYEMVIENHLHYFLGRNPQAVCYFGGEGDNNYAAYDTAEGLLDRADWNAELLFIMSEVMSWYGNA